MFLLYFHRIPICNNVLLNYLYYAFMTILYKDNWEWYGKCLPFLCRKMENF